MAAAARDCLDYGFRELELPATAWWFGELSQLVPAKARASLS